MSKNRRANLKKAKQKRVTAQTIEPLTRPIRIKGHELARIRKNEDFISLVKIGRLANVIAFGAQSMADYINGSSPVHRRQLFRSSLLTGAYLYEGTELVRSLRSRYQEKDYFTTFLQVLDNKYEKKRKVLQIVRHKLAFHLDSDDNWTRKAIKILPARATDLASGESDRMMDFYFDFSDVIDHFSMGMEFNRIMKSNLSDIEAVRSVYRIIAEMYPLFLGGAHDFLTGMGVELKISELTD